MKLLFRFLHRRIVMTAIVSPIFMLASCIQGPQQSTTDSKSRIKLDLSQLQAIPISAEPLDESSISDLAEKISLLVEGPGSPGSGVIISQHKNIIYALTAWHVLKSYVPGEELQVRTYDNNNYNIDPSSIQKIDGVDLALFSFTSNKKYKYPRIGRVETLSSGDDIYVSGFPLATTSVPKSIFRFLSGSIVAKSSEKLEGGYDLLYSNPTLPGMSGGSVLSKKGGLIAIHGKAETDFAQTEQNNIAIKTGINQAIPITYLVSTNSLDSGSKISDQSSESEKLLVSSTQKIEMTKKLFKSMNKSELLNPSQRSEFDLFRGSLIKQAIALVSEAIEKKPELGYPYYLRGTYKKMAKNIFPGDKQFSYESQVADYDKAINYSPNLALAYSEKANVLWLKDYGSDTANAKAKRLYEKALGINPYHEQIYTNYGQFLSSEDTQNYILTSSNPRSALKLYLRGLENIPTSAWLNYEVARGLGYQSSDKIFEIMNALEKEAFDKKTFDYDNQSSQNQRWRAIAEKQIGYVEVTRQILDLLDTSLNLKPNNSSYLLLGRWELRAEVKASIGDYKGAVEDLSNEIQMNSFVRYEKPYQLARYYEESNQAEKALEVISSIFDKSKYPEYINGPDFIKLDSNDWARINMYAAELSRKLGKKSEACIYLDKYITYRNQGSGRWYSGSKSQFLSWAKECQSAEVTDYTTRDMELNN